MCLFISVSPLMSSQLVQGISLTSAQYILGLTPAPTAPWWGLERKCSLLCESCLCVCMSMFVGSGRSKRGIKFMELLFCQALNSPPQHPTVLLEAATKTDRKKRGKSSNSNCHLENTSQTERDQIEGGHYHFYYCYFPSSKAVHCPSLRK